MSQIDMFSSSRSRRSDPFTSKEAGRSIGGGVNRLQKMVLDFIMLHRGCTDREMVETLRKEHGGSESTYRTRRAELVDMGLVRALGMVEVGGKKHQTWTATADAFR